MDDNALGTLNDAKHELERYADDMTYTASTLRHIGCRDEGNGLYNIAEQLRKLLPRLDEAAESEAIR